MTTTRMTGAQALVEAMIAEGIETVFGLFGHGNVQLGQALWDRRDRIRFVPVRNEQAGVHAAAAIARLTGRPAAVTTSVGPGATNLVTGAAMCRINRWPVLLLPGEVFAENVGPVLQELESTVDATANESLRPVSKYWSRVARAEQLRRTIAEAFEAMLEPGDEGPATLCLPMDVQAEAFEVDRERLVAPRDRRPQRVGPDPTALAEAIALLASARRPLLVAGGGVLRSGAMAELAALAEHLGAAVAPTQAGKGSILFEHPLNVFAVGPTGATVGNELAARADVVVGIGTRYADFTTASETAYAPDARFVNVNLCHGDVGKQRALKLWGDARTTLAALLEGLRAAGVAPRGEGRGPAYRGRTEWAAEIAAGRERWIAATDAWRGDERTPIRQARAIGILNDALGPDATILSAAGTLPGELQKLWRDRDPAGLGYVCEYGYSTMGFEIAAGLGAKLARPERRIVVLVGDLSFLMMPGELVTAVQLGVPFTVVVFDNRGGQSIRGLQRRSGFADHGMELTTPAGEPVPLDFARIAEGMGCRALRAEDEASLRAALAVAAETTDRPTVIDLKVHKDDFTPGTGGWWDVPQPAVDASGAPSPARERYLAEKRRQVIR